MNSSQAELQVPDRTRRAISLVSPPIRSLPFAAAFAALCGLLQAFGVPVGGLAVFAALYAIGVFLFFWAVVVVHDMNTLLGPSPRLFTRQLRFWRLLGAAVFRQWRRTPATTTDD